MAGKQYGLIKPQKPSTRLLAFGSDSESDDEPAKKKISIGESSSQKRQARIMQEDALKEDPTIFQYDEVYDEMSANREEAKKAKTTEHRESKYISRLLVTAEKRKLEYETRLERKVQKERDAEGDQFKDKEVFVTKAYREKLEALKKAEEEAQREEYLESIGDVRKQNDLSGFYRHVYEQKLGSDKTEAKSSEKTESIPEIKKIDEKTTKRRTYRRHGDSENSDEEEEQNTAKTDGKPASKKVHLQSNLDADSDFSIDDSDSEPDEDAKETTATKEETKQEKKSSQKSEQTKTEKSDGEKEDKQKVEQVENSAIDSANDVKDSNKDTELDKVKMPPPKETKPKVDIWLKRTVGDVYLAAVKRYYERKQVVA